MALIVASVSRNFRLQALQTAYLPENWHTVHRDMDVCIDDSYLYLNNITCRLLRVSEDEFNFMFQTTVYLITVRSLTNSAFEIEVHTFGIVMVY